MFLTVTIFFSINSRDEFCPKNEDLKSVYRDISL